MKWEPWGNKQRRAYQRVMTGLQFSGYLNHPIRFMTLTTSNQAPRDVQTSFHVLKERIKREFGDFEYFKVRTNEGNGVIHILYRGRYIPKWWLKNAWFDIHRTYIVDIRVVRGIKGLAKYVISQYVCNQRSSYQRCSYSANWVFPGFAKRWYTIRRWFRQKDDKYWTYTKAFEVWQKLLKRVANNRLQTCLNDFG